MLKIDKRKLTNEIKEKYLVEDNAFKLSDIKNAELDKYKNEPKDQIDVIVGDDKQPDNFLPQVKLCRWSNEVNFSLRRKDYGEAELKYDKDHIVWENGKEKIEFYNYTEGEGGYKLVWFLKEKPKTNKI